MYYKKPFHWDKDHEVDCAFPYSFDEFETLRSFFREEYRKMSPKERQELFDQIKVGNALEKSGGYDPAFYTPDDMDIDRIFWELVKNDLRRWIYYEEMPLMFAHRIQDMVVCDRYGNLNELFLEPCISNLYCERVTQKREQKGSDRDQDRNSG